MFHAESSPLSFERRGVSRYKRRMLARLSIRDIVLIDRLDIDLPGGMTVLTVRRARENRSCSMRSPLPLAGAGMARLCVTGRRRAR